MQSFVFGTSIILIALGMVGMAVWIAGFIPVGISVGLIIVGLALFLTACFLPTRQ